ncbi:transcriptional regulator [Escherichia coli]|nr:transcriptional regulator [Escherichia coli]
MKHSPGNPGRFKVLRLKQISGLTELFQEEDFSPAWTVR